MTRIKKTAQVAACMTVQMSDIIRMVRHRREHQSPKMSSARDRNRNPSVQEELAEEFANANPRTRSRYDR